MSANLRAKVLLLAVLELIVGGIVVLGGAALVYFSSDSTGMSLGVVHAILGLMAFLAGYLLLTGKARARTLTLGVDAAIIAFSTISEIILTTTGSLPSGPFMDPSPRPLRAANTKSAGQVTRSRANKIKGRLL